MLTLQLIEKRIKDLYGQADDAEAERKYELAGKLRDTADSMAEEIATAVVFDASQELPS